MSIYNNLLFSVNYWKCIVFYFFLLLLNLISQQYYYKVNYLYILLLVFCGFIVNTLIGPLREIRYDSLDYQFYFNSSLTGWLNLAAITLWRYAEYNIQHLLQYYDDMLQFSQENWSWFTHIFLLLIHLFHEIRELKHVMVLNIIVSRYSTFKL